MGEQERDVESMLEFFDQRSAGYDQHMQQSITGFEAFYESIAAPVKSSDSPIRILDLGCGTGLTFDYIFVKVPQARITAVDISGSMLGQMERKYVDRRDQIEVIQDSYFNLDFPPDQFHYILAVMTFHHLLPDDKLSMYREILRWLKAGGVYVEGDYMVSGVEERESLQAYNRIRERLKAAAPGLYHVDVPLSVGTQRKLLLEAGFRSVKEIWHQEQAAVLQAERAR